MIFSNGQRVQFPGPTKVWGGEGWWLEGEMGPSW